MDMAMDTLVHNHSAHASSPAMVHGSVVRHDDGTYTYTHGAWLGHVVPGTFFLLWGVWWTLGTFYAHLSAAAGASTFKSKASHRLFFGPPGLRRFPVEPIIKIILPTFGMLGEIWLGHEHYQNLYESDSKFVMDHINNWQHVAMYAPFVLSGLVDLAVLEGLLPSALDQAILGMAFLIEGMLLAFHLKGPEIEVVVHVILVIQIFCTAIAVVFETLLPHSFTAACARPLSTVVQGAWWIQAAYMMFRAKAQWDPDYMGSAMMAPVSWVTITLLCTACMLAVYVGMRVFTQRVLGWHYVDQEAEVHLAGPSLGNKYTAVRPSGRTGDTIDLELSALNPAKY